MDDPLFDPWGFEAEPPAERSAKTPSARPPAKAGSGPRWRPPSGLSPGLPATSAQHVAHGLKPLKSGMVPKARLAGAPGFLRSMAAPRLHEFVGQLQMAHHEASMEDDLEGAPPRLRLAMRPWRGPWTEDLAPPQGILELSLPEGAEGPVTVRVWLDAEAATPDEESRVPTARLGAAWLEQLVLGFVERLLARA